MTAEGFFGWCAFPFRLKCVGCGSSIVKVQLNRLG